MGNAKARSAQALDTAQRKGREAAKAGLPESANPYPRVHYGRRSQFAGVWWKNWAKGYREQIAKQSGGESGTVER